MHARDKFIWPVLLLKHWFCVSTIHERISVFVCQFRNKKIHRLDCFVFDFCSYFDFFFVSNSRGRYLLDCFVDAASIVIQKLSLHDWIEWSNFVVYSLFISLQIHNPCNYFQYADIIKMNRKLFVSMSRYDALCVVCTHSRG